MIKQWIIFTHPLAVPWAGGIPTGIRYRQTGWAWFAIAVCCVSGVSEESEIVCVIVSSGISNLICRVSDMSVFGRKYVMFMSIAVH
jgi:hypothetical protein